MIDKLIDLLVIAAGSLLALCIWCCCVVASEEDERMEPVHQNGKKHSGLLEED